MTDTKKYLVDHLGNNTPFVNICQYVLTLDQDGLLEKNLVFRYDQLDPSARVAKWYTR